MVGQLKLSKADRRSLVSLDPQVISAQQETQMQEEYCAPTFDILGIHANNHLGVMYPRALILLQGSRKSV